MLRIQFEPISLIPWQANNQDSVSKILAFCNFISESRHVMSCHVSRSIFRWDLLKLGSHMCQYHYNPLPPNHVLFQLYSHLDIHMMLLYRLRGPRTVGVRLLHLMG